MSSAVSTAHVVESTDVSAFPAEVVDVKTGVEEPPVAVQATAAFLPAAEKEIVRDVTRETLATLTYHGTELVKHRFSLAGSEGSVGMKADDTR